MPLFVDRAASIPLRQQLANALRDSIKAGHLGPRTRLPSSRALATDLGVSRGVVTDAYAQLVAEGYIDQRQGAAPRVRNLSQVEVTTTGDADFKPRLTHELVGTVPDLSLFPRKEWLAAVRRSLTGMPNSELGYGDPRGTPEMREELASYLRRVRGVSGTGERIVITHGYTQGLSLACRVLVRRGATHIAVENPSDDDQWEVIRRAGLEVVPCPVDESGLIVDRVIERDVDAVVATPAHQFPTGAVMAPERRSQLAEWAASNGKILIEDDYDSAYRYDRDPVGTIQGLAPESCIQIGSVSKLLAPALRMGWMIIPSAMTGSVARERWATDGGHRAIDQRAFVEFILSGDLDRHLRQTRHIYRTRRDRLVKALESAVPDGEIKGIAAGLHLVLRLPPGVEEGIVCKKMAQKGIHLRGIATYQMGTEPLPPALVVGYGAIADASLEMIVRTLGLVIDEARPPADRN
ncbi:MAG: PLP-dependent aminotransferase family protein [Thermoleophilia bacterium]|nr:PLP-dependent aminotransferase family protein [Thermoleophilia bacterium]